MGFVMSLTPLSTNLMGWRVHVNDGAAEMFGTLLSFVLFATETDSGRAAYFFFGGILMLVAGVLELILKNTFLSMVFMSFGMVCFHLGTFRLHSLTALDRLILALLWWDSSTFLCCPSGVWRS